MTVTTDTPAMPLQGVPRPNDGAFRRQVEDINLRVTEIQDELRTIQEQLNVITEGGGIGDVEKKAELRLGLNASQDRIQVLENSRRLHQERLADYQRAIQQHSVEVNQKRSSLQFQSLDSVKQRVHELQSILQKSNLSLQDEKNTIKEISQLKQKIPSIKASLREVEQLESTSPDFTTDIQASQQELERIRDEIDHERKHRREIQNELRSTTESEGEERTKRNQIIDELMIRRETLTEARDEQTSLLIDAQNIFNSELEEYREYESRKKKMQQEKVRERKRLERQKIERQELLDQMADCVVEDDGNDESGQRLLQLYTYCQTELDKINQGRDVPSPKKKKAVVNISLIGEFGSYGLKLPATKEDYEHALTVLEPLLDKQESANSKVFEAITTRRIVLQAKLDALDARIEQENSPKKST